MNLWILTEERPKKEVIELIIRKLAEDNKLKVNFEKVKIRPIIKNKKFSFTYKVVGVNLESIDDILIKIVSGESSFVDFLIFLQENEPDANSLPLYAIEETKTADVESRNTGVYQRCSKFVYCEFYYPQCKKIMLYNIKVKSKKKPSETNIFGTRMLMTLGVEVLGKTLDNNTFKKFNSIDELIDFKNHMKRPPSGNVPILIKKVDECIEISGRLYKAGGLSHDPNIGALTIIAATLRKLGWNKDIIITQHGLSQQHVNERNKFVKIANKINIKLKGLTLPQSSLPTEYWYYEKESEKIVTIFLHLLLEEMVDVEVIYENHAGCERGYFKIPSGEFVTIHKYIENDKSKGIVSLPDLIVCDHKRKQILCIEGKKYENVEEGITELKDFDPIEKEYIKKYYPGYNVTRHVVLFGSYSSILTRPEVAFLLNSNGEMILSKNTPEVIKDAIEELLSVANS